MTHHNAIGEYSRRNFFSLTQFHVKFVGIILLLMFITALLCSIVVYFSSMSLLVQKLANVYPQGRLIGIIATVNIRMLVAVLILAPVVALIGIYLAHKIAGPLDRMERFLGHMAKGDISSRIVVRRGDEFSNVVNAMNVMSETWTETIARQRKNLERVLKELDTLKKQVDSRPKDVAQLDSNIDRLHNEIQDLESSLDWYKI